MAINEIFYLFWLSKQENIFNEKYYLLLLLLVSKINMTNQQAKDLLNSWHLDYEKTTKREKKILSKLRDK